MNMTQSLLIPFFLLPPLEVLPIIVIRCIDLEIESMIALFGFDTAATGNALIL